MKSPLASGLVMAALVAAGCLGAVSPDAGTASVPDDGFVDGWSRHALPVGEGHDHADPAAHRNLTTSNFDVVGYDPLITDHHGRTSGDYLCGSSKSDGDRRLSIVHSWGSDVGFVLVDTTDPEDPKKVAEFVMRNTQVYDVDLSPDLDYVILGTSPYDSGPDREDLPGPADRTMPKLEWTSACTGETQVVPLPADAPYASGAVLVDIAEVSNPEVVDYKPLPVGGAHSVHAKAFDGQQLVVAAVFDSEHSTSYFAFYEIEDGPGQPRLAMRSIYQYEPASDVGGDKYGVHDAWMQEHPVTGRRLAYLAHGSSGLVIVDIEDPTDPALVGQWNDWNELGEGGEMLGHYAHTAKPITTTWDGRHYTFVGEECLSQPPEAPSCLIMTLDTTDPADPRYVGFWTLPHQVSWDAPLAFSLHYVDVQDRTLFVSAYHGGLWAVDLSTPERIAEMPSVGVFLPANESPKPVGETPRSYLSNYAVSSYPLDYTPVVLDPQVNDDGTVTVNDVTSGIYTVRFDHDAPAPAPAPFRFG